MNIPWYQNPYRTETIVLNFRDKESFAAFWDKYIKGIKGEAEGVSYSVIATGNRMKLLDECQDCLYKAMNKIPYVETELLEKMEKLAEA